MSGKSRAAMMEETRAKLISAGRKAFAEKGFAGGCRADARRALS
jgi:AcrR family transcriptional regulator